MVCFPDFEILGNPSRDGGTLVLSQPRYFMNAHPRTLRWFCWKRLNSLNLALALLGFPEEERNGSFVPILGGEKIHSTNKRWNLLSPHILSSSCRLQISDRGSECDMGRSDDGIHVMCYDDMPRIPSDSYRLDSELFLPPFFCFHLHAACSCRHPKWVHSSMLISYDLVSVCLYIYII